MAFAAAENLEATVIAKVTDENRLVMLYGGEKAVNISRDFLNTNGAPKKAAVTVKKTSPDGLLDGFYGERSYILSNDIEKLFGELMSDLNVCSKRGLAERFDSTIGAGSVVMPFSGRKESADTPYMAAKIPVNGETDSASYMANAFDPYLAEKSPYHGGLYAVIESVSRLVAAGIDYKDIYLTLQEYFGRTNGIPERWGLPFAALLGAFRAQTELGIGAIGGKDSMSGSFEKLDVPPTLISFAVAKGSASGAITPEFKQADSYVYLISQKYSRNAMPDFTILRETFEYINNLANSGNLLSASAIGYGGLAEAIVKASFGNMLGFNAISDLNLMLPSAMLAKHYGSFMIETKEPIDDHGIVHVKILGRTAAQPAIKIYGRVLKLSSLLNAYTSPLEGVFPTKPQEKSDIIPPIYSFNERTTLKAKTTFAKPKVLIPVFPGTNCEYDTARAFAKAGGDCEIFVFRNKTASDIEESIAAFSDKIGKTQILAIPGGFSGGDEPDGSGKFICAVFRAPRVKEATEKLLYTGDGLMLGICNGFQALLKTGLLPYGKIENRLNTDSPTLTYNTIGRHYSGIVKTRVASVKSPWLSALSVGDIISVPVSHGEGRFMATDEEIARLAANGQIAFQYCDGDTPTMHCPENPNGSKAAIEGIISEDGRILGKMGHSERVGDGLYRNVAGRFDSGIFNAGTRYYN
jgi:phosphoribosylformylglycinamidine synthase